MTRTDGTMKGILLGFACFATFSLSDTCVKLIEGGLPPYESAFFGAVLAIVTLPFLMRHGDRVTDVFATTNRPLWLLRFVAYPTSVIGSVTAFTHLSMAEAFALIFLQPAIVTIMSVMFLKEQVGLRRWLAVIVGFIGVLIVLRPGFRELSIGHLGAALAGVSGATLVIIFRALGTQEKKISLFGAGVSGAILVCGCMMLPGFIWPTMHEWLLLLGYGLLAAFSNILLMQAATLAPAAYLSPTQYSQMLWALLLGEWLFGDRLDMPMLAGIVLIVGSGLLTLNRERVRGTPLPPPLTGNGQTPLALTPEATSSPS